MFRPIYRSSSGMFHKKQTKFLELGSPNMDPYYGVGCCYYLANLPLDDVNRGVQCLKFTRLLLMVKTY
jgi:hypothetical protein